MAISPFHLAKKTSYKFLTGIILPCSLALTYSGQASAVEITPIAGYTFSPSIASGDARLDTSVSNDTNLGLAIAWSETTQKQGSNQGQGQVLINYINRDFTSATNGQKQEFSTYYAHFNGVTFIQEDSYTTTIGFGLGAAFFDTDYDSAVYPSFTASIGTRHALATNLHLVTEVRAYASLVKEDDKLFCQADSCYGYFDNSFWLDGMLSVGIAYQF